MVKMPLAESVTELKRSGSKIAVIVLFFIALALALGGAALLFLAMENEFDTSIMHFDFDSVYALGALCASLGALALAIAGFFSASKKLSFTGDNRCTFLGTFISALTGLMCLLYFVLNVKKGLPETKRALLMIELTFVVLSAIFFFLKASGLFAKKPGVALSGLIPALMSAFILFYLYFNASEPLNSPLKIYQIVMLATFMLYFTAETGVAISRPKMGKKYVFAGIVATGVGGIVALSRLAARIFDVDVFDFDIVTAAFHAIIWLYIVISFAEKLLLSREIKEESAFFDSEAAGSETEEAIEEVAEASEDTAEDAEEAPEKVEEIAEDAADEADDALEEAAECAEAAEDVADKAEEAVEDTTEAIDDKVDEAKDALDDDAKEAEESVDEVFEKVKAEAEKLTAEAAEKNE